jgi:hypothetical protein
VVGPVEYQDSISDLIIVKRQKVSFASACEENDRRTSFRNSKKSEGRNFEVTITIAANFDLNRNAQLKQDATDVLKQKTEEGTRPEVRECGIARVSITNESGTETEAGC